MNLRFISLLFCALNLMAQLKSVRLDPASSPIEWTLGGSLHTTHGTFKLKSGQIQFDPATGKASGEIVVDARSGESGNDTRDGRMHKSVLESDKFPEIRFKADRFEGPVKMDGPSSIKLHGSFEIHGKAHEITLPVDLKIDNAKLTADLKFDVPYVAWGMKDPSNFLLKVDKTVTIVVKVSASL